MAEGSSGKRNVIYQLKITLLDIKPLIWRRIQLPADYTLSALHLAIQNAMGWKNYHLYEFWLVKEKTPGRRRDYSVGRITDEMNKICKYLIKPTDALEYNYDLGDNWEHNIVLEKILHADPNVRYPICIGGKRACPPEDVGGPDGYESHLEILANPNHVDYQDTVKWTGQDASHDPEKFDKKSIIFGSADLGD